MALSLAAGNRLQVTCSKCGQSYDWGQNCQRTPYSTGEGLALQHRNAFKVSCPGCGTPEAAWSLAVQDAILRR